MIPLDARMQAAQQALMSGLGHGVPIPGRTDVSPVGYPGMRTGGLVRPSPLMRRRLPFPPAPGLPFGPPPVMPTHLAALRALYG